MICHEICHDRKHKIAHLICPFTFKILVCNHVLYLEHRWVLVTDVCVGAVLKFIAGCVSGSSFWNVFCVISCPLSESLSYSIMSMSKVNRKQLVLKYMARALGGCAMIRKQKMTNSILKIHDRNSNNAKYGYYTSCLKHRLCVHNFISTQTRDRIAHNCILLLYEFNS